MNRSVLSKLLIVSRLPEEIVKLLSSPGMLSVTSALQITKLLKDKSDADIEEVVIQLRQKAEGSPFASSHELIKSLKPILAPTQTLSAREKMEFKGKNGVEFVITRNRQIDKNIELSWPMSIRKRSRR